MGRHKATQPSAKHLDILRCIAEANQENISPVKSDLARRLGRRGVSSICDTLAKMEELGLIEMVPCGSGKVVSMTQHGREEIGIRGIPLMGTVPAGKLSEALDTASEYFSIEDLIPHEQADFLTRVQGESMVGAGICPGDLVLLRPLPPQDIPKQGEIVAVSIGEEHKLTLKKFYLGSSKQQYRLVAANPAFEDQIVNAKETRILGVFQALIRHRSSTFL